MTWVSIFIILIGAFLYLYQFVISQNQFAIYDLPLAVPSTIVDVHGRELYTFFQERRTPVSYEAISPIMVDALISAEDKDFWINDGFDPRGMARSAIVTLNDRWDNGFLWYSQWASTLTQQIIKNQVVGKEKTLNRKIHEIIHAWLLTYNTYAQNKDMMSDSLQPTIWLKTKQDIITYYLNSTFFGNHAYGISQAARTYFDIHPKDLTIGQSAVLASIPKSPTFFDPYRYRANVAGTWQISIDYGWAVDIDPEQYGDIFRDLYSKLSYPDTFSGQNIISLLPTFEGTNTDDAWLSHHRTIFYTPGRKDYVIQRLYEDGKISLSEALEAMITPLVFAPKPTQINTIQAPHFVYYIRDAILRNSSLGITEHQLFQWWYTITTTLDLDIQQWLEQVVAKDTNELNRLWANNRAVLVTDTRDGEILWYVGSLNFYDTSIQWQNDLIRTRRQTWSTLKPLIYAYGMMMYPFGMDTKIRDVQTNFNGYRPNNADGSFQGNISLKNALAGSRNVPAIKMFHAMWWVNTFVPWFTELGMQWLSLTGWYGLSMALGTAPMDMIDLAQWYTHLSDTPDAGMIHGVSRIQDQYGFTIFEHGDFLYARKIPLGVSRLITYILQTPLFAPRYFRSTTEVPSCPSCASKTGTTNIKVNGRNVPRDGWLVTYNPDVVVTMRAGNTDASPLSPQAYGYLLNTQLRNDIFEYLISKNLTSDDSHRSYPDGVTRAYRGHGEGYIDPVHKIIPQGVRGRL